MLYIVGLFVFVAVVIYCSILVMFPLKYRAEIKHYAKLNNLEPALVAAIINAESGFDPNAVSNKGAVGLMQILPTTATYIIRENVDLFDYKINIEVGTKYLKYLFDKFKDNTTMLIAYNAGEGNVAKWIDAGVVCPFPETNNYVKKILGSVKFYSFRI
jgi:soluble lytic murein transglycosylase